MASGLFRSVAQVEFIHRLAPEAQKRLQFNIFKTDEAIVSWWQAVEKDGKRAHGEIHSFGIELQAFCLLV